MCSAVSEKLSTDESELMKSSEFVASVYVKSSVILTSVDPLSYVKSDVRTLLFLELADSNITSDCDAEDCDADERE